MSHSSNTEIWALVPAAGIGARMQAELPKQYLRIGTRTILDLTLEKLLAVKNIKGVVLALHPNDQWWPKSEYTTHPKIHVTEGGDERCDSVVQALRYLLQECAAQSHQANVWALVHDAARPCVAIEKIHELIEFTFEKFSKTQALGGILASPCADTVKRGEHGLIRKTEDRSHLWLAHTPQFFPAEKLLQSIQYALANNINVTDEASAIEADGGKVALIHDRRDNIKITLPEDLLWAETILKTAKEHTKETKL
ncbi:MAG: 2-C-methyl-D-erythritol 4-phosphate cytidylyltransferase [Agarilytica sp.]